MSTSKQSESESGENVFYPIYSDFSCRTAGTTFVDTFQNQVAVHAFNNLDYRRCYPRIVIRPDVRINPSDLSYYTDKEKEAPLGWFPFIIRLKSGDLLCFYSEGSSHATCHDGRSVVVRSADGGRTWGMPVIILQMKCRSEIHGVCQTSGGRIWVGTCNQCYNEKIGPREDYNAWKYINTILYSDDDGITWKKVWESPSISPPAAWSNIRQPRIEMSNGQLLWLGCSIDEYGETIRSTLVHNEVNGSIEFEQRCHPELGPTGNEWTVVETRHPGVLVAIMRQSQHGQYFATSRSSDYGKTWTDWSMSNVFAGPTPTRPSLRRTEDGTLLLCYGQRWIGRTFVVPSHDDGQTWDISHRQVILHSPDVYHNQCDSHYCDIARAEGTTWLAIDYVASPKKFPQQAGIYGTFIQEEHFKNVLNGLTLKQYGSLANSNTTAYWSFDELEGNIANEPVGNHYGEIYGAIRQEGYIGGALLFDGKDDYVMVYDDETLRVPRYFTLEAWINARDTQREHVIISKAPHYTFGITEGRLFLEVGNERALAEMKAPLLLDKWVHIAVSFGIRLQSSRVTFFINGEEDSCRAMHREAETYLKRCSDTLELTDMQITEGPMYQERRLFRKNESKDNLVIGMDNNLKSRPFNGLIDEVAIHRNALRIEFIRKSYNRGYASIGNISSRPIVCTDGAVWSKFNAKVTIVKGTKVTFSIEDKFGKVLLKNVTDGTDISCIKADAIVLIANLTTTRKGQTPILHEWSISCKDEDCVKVHTEVNPFPYQSATEALGCCQKEPENKVLL